tara:strand:- start:171 stop:647 length:477 start_codon:yes stop_codon:yes gene_type:complete
MADQDLIPDSVVDTKSENIDLEILESENNLLDLNYYLKFIMKHKLFLIILLVGIIFGVYLYYRSIRADDKTQHEITTEEEDTEEMMNKLDLNLTSNVNKEHIDNIKDEVEEEMEEIEELEDLDLGVNTDYDNHGENELTLDSDENPEELEPYESDSEL